MARSSGSGAGNDRASSRQLEALRSGIVSQLQRASLSVQLKIAEEYAFGEPPTYLRHFRIAYGSAVETGELLETALKADMIPAYAFLPRSRCL